MIMLLQQLSQLLNKHGHPGQAATVERLLYLHDAHWEEFISLLQSVDVWGGAGAIWEVANLNEDEGQFRVLIIELARKMDHMQIGTNRSKYIASVFSDWKRDHQ